MTGRRWRSLAEQAGDPALAARRASEFPESGPRLSRRRVLGLMAASLALAGRDGTAAATTAHEAVPYVTVPPGVTPGATRHYATALTNGGYAEGVLVTHRMGRPLKIEGNPDHPASLGATDAIGQAAILDLYDPGRSAAILRDGMIASGDSLIATLLAAGSDARADGGARIRLLSGPVTSPTLAAQIAALRRQLPALEWHVWDGEPRDQQRAGARLAFGRPLDLLPQPAAARVILAVDSDLLDGAPGHLAHARGFAKARRPVEQAPPLPPPRLYAIESTPTLTGARADHRLVVGPDAIEPALRALAAALGVAPSAWGVGAPDWIAPLADDLARHPGAALVHVGPAQPAAVQALAHLVNERLGAAGRTLQTIEPVEAGPVDHLASLAALVEAMRAGRVSTLVVLGGNPVFTAPADLDFAGALRQVPLTVHLGVRLDETAAACRWHVPESHELERWGDARAFDGTLSIQQPQIRPLFGGWSPLALLALFGGEPRPSDAAILRAAWAARAQAAGLADPGRAWQAALRRGVVADSAAPAVAAPLRTDLVDRLGPPPARAAGGLTLLLRPDPYLRDGRHADNGWLQELPRPLTSLTWGNAALVAPATARRLGLASEELVELDAAGARVRLPVWVMPGQAPDCVTVALGHGRRVAGPVGRGVGVDAGPLRRSAAPWQVGGITVRPTGLRARLAATQHHQMIDDDESARSVTLAALQADPQAVRRPEPDASLYPAWPYPRNAWAMAISLDACIGCGACTAACQAENNIPVVGPDEVRRNRQMHWIRVDRWFAGAPELPDEILFQPVPCMHCENAPCEVVCPVAATVHDTDGLNVMVYNRCVGTRFCSNNCPYKVRRFNYHDYAEDDPRVGASWNPAVSVRARGVMEKCTYCIQRIREVRIEADRVGRPIADGTLRTACQQVCPTEAITFGDRNDPESAVARRQSSPLDYAVRAELNTRPRTRYLARVRHPRRDGEAG